MTSGAHAPRRTRTLIDSVSQLARLGSLADGAAADATAASLIMDGAASSNDAAATPGSIFRNALARVAAQTESSDQPPPPPAVVARAYNAAAFLKVVAPLLLPRADPEFLTLELAAAAAACCPEGGDYYVVRSGDQVVLGALRPPIGDPTTLRLCGDGGDGVVMRAALLLADCLAADAALPGLEQISGPASLAEAFARQFAFKRRSKAPERTGGLRIFSRRRSAASSDGPRPERVPALTGPSSSDRVGASSKDAATVAAWLEACEREGGIDEAHRTPGLIALERFGGVYARRRMNGDLACICGVVGSAASPGGRRVGLVYTPANLRKAGHATALVNAVTSELLNDSSGPAFAVVVVPAVNNAPDGLWTRAGYSLVGDTADFRLDPAPRELAPTASPVPAPAPAPASTPAAAPPPPPRPAPGAAPAPEPTRSAYSSDYSRWDRVADDSDAETDEGESRDIFPTGRKCDKCDLPAKIGPCRVCNFAYCSRACEVRARGCCGVIETKPKFIRIHGLTFWQRSDHSDEALDAAQNEAKYIQATFDESRS